VLSQLQGNSSTADTNMSSAALESHHSMVHSDTNVPFQSDSQSTTCVEQTDSLPASSQELRQTGKPYWSKEATLAFLHLYQDAKEKFDSPRFKNNAVWKEISDLLQKEGFHFTADQVMGRWKTLLAAYRRVSDHNNKMGNDRKEFQYMEQMTDILGVNPTITPQCTISSVHGQQTHATTPNNKCTLSSTTAAGCSNELPLSPTTATSSSNHDKENVSPVPVPKKRRYVGKKPDIANWFEGYQAQQVAAEERRLELAKKIHDDNMNVWTTGHFENSC